MPLNPFAITEKAGEEPHKRQTSDIVNIMKSDFIDSGLLKSIEGKKRELDAFRPFSPELVRMLEVMYNRADIPGVFASQRALLNYLDTVSANYIMTRAEATNQTPAQIIGKMVRHEIAERI
jgi:hypothetical protein